MNFFRVSSRINTQTLVRNITSKTNTYAVQKGGLNMFVTPNHSSKLVSSSPTFEGKWDQSQKHMMIGLGCSVFIDLCAEAMFFKKVPYSIYKESLELVMRNEYTQNRIGKDIIRKGNKFGVWPNREGGRKVLVAHYYVQGEKGDAKVLLHVEKRHFVYQAILLIVEFPNLDRLTLLEVEEEQPQESCMPAL